jgi:hypothetical protein
MKKTVNRCVVESHCDGTAARLSLCSMEMASGALTRLVKDDRADAQRSHATQGHVSRCDHGSDAFRLSFVHLPTTERTVMLEGSAMLRTCAPLTNRIGAAVNTVPFCSIHPKGMRC